MTNAADPKAVKARNRSERRAMERHKEDTRWVMSDPKGRRFVLGVINRGGMNRSSFTGNSQTFFNEGMRNLALMVYADVMTFCPEAYLLAMEEAARTEKREAEPDPAQPETPEKEDEDA